MVTESEKNTAIIKVEQEIFDLIRDLTSQFPKDMIESEEELVGAANALTRIRDFLRNTDKIRVQLVKPLKDHVSYINNLFKQRTDPVRNEDRRIKVMMSTYRAQVQEERQRQYEDNLKKAEETFKNDSPIPEIVAPIPEDTGRLVETDTGQVGFITIWKWEVVDEEKIPKEYFALNEAKITKVVKAGLRKIPGIRTFSEQVPSVRVR